MGLQGLEPAEQKKSGGPPGLKGVLGAGGQAGPGRSITQAACAEPGGGQGERSLRLLGKPRGRGRRLSPGLSKRPAARKAPAGLAGGEGRGIKS